MLEQPEHSVRSDGNRTVQSGRGHGELRSAIPIEAENSVWADGDRSLDGERPEEGSTQGGQGSLSDTQQRATPEGDPLLHRYVCGNDTEAPGWHHERPVGPRWNQFGFHRRWGSCVRYGSRVAGEDRQAYTPRPGYFPPPQAKDPSQQGRLLRRGQAIRNTRPFCASNPLGSSLPVTRWDDGPEPTRDPSPFHRATPSALELDPCDGSSQSALRCTFAVPGCWRCRKGLSDATCGSCRCRRPRTASASPPLWIVAGSTFTTPRPVGSRGCRNAASTSNVDLARTGSGQRRLIGVHCPQLSSEARR